MKKISSKVNQQQYFNTDHLKSDLKGRSVRGGAITIATQATRFVLQMAALVVSARLLTPEDYGIVGMTAILFGFVGSFKDLGLMGATIQKTEINHKQVSTLFWINLAISSMFSLVVAGLAPLLAWFYNEPRLIAITLVMATNFIITGLSVQHYALLLRQMQFSVLGKIDIITMLVGILTTIIFAWYGFGYWALVFMQVTTTVTNSAAAWIVCRWRPGRPIRNSGIRSMLAFGRNLSGFRLVDFFTRNLDNVLIGRYWGPQELGLYAKAYQILLLPIQQISNPINSVALSALSSLQNEPEKYRRYYYKAILLITTIGMPIVGFMFASADKVILLMLGQQWLGAVSIFRFLMPAAFIGTFNVATAWVYESLGRTDRQFRAGIVTSSISVITFMISVRWGVIAVAAAFGLSQLIVIFPRVVYCYKGTSLRLIDLLTTLSRPALASIGAAVGMIGINYLLEPDLNVIISLVIDLVLYTLLYLGIWIVLPDGRHTLFEILQMTKTLRKKPK